MARSVIAGLLLALVCCSIQAQSVAAADEKRQPDSSVLADSGFALLPDLPLKNQIPLLDNRFRIDDQVSEITLLFFRRRGSASVILVRPDGTKLRFSNAEEHNLRWHDANTYDLIQIKDPMPGPWQAVGRLLPESRIMVLTDISLKVDELPKTMMVGETVKVTARILNGEEQANVRDFRDVLTLDVRFISTNKPEFDNFGLGVVQVAQFRDDGRGYDEKARDGIFTGEYYLNFPAGEWIPKYVVRTPLYTREIEQAPVVVYQMPVKADVAQATTADGPHQVTFTVIDPKVVDSSVLLQGRIRYPDGDIESFSLNEQNSGPRQLKIQNKGDGSYVVEASVFGETTSGREFMLNIPDAGFMVDPLVLPAPAITELPSQVQNEIAAEQQARENQAQFPWTMVIIANLLILGGGGFAIWFVMTDRKITELMFWRKKEPVLSTVAAPVAAEKKSDTASKAQKNNDMDDILDLSLPDD